MASIVAIMAQRAATAADEPLVSLTPRAIEAVKQVRAREGRPEDHALRVAVVGGGCSGFSYQLNFDQATQEGDTVLEYEGVRVLVDATSAPYLQGTEIDFVSSLHGGGFKFSNPKASQTCGCGSSFAV
jgi:iron-sulfur cluster assembly accessory protein